MCLNFFNKDVPLALVCDGFSQRHMLIENSLQLGWVFKQVMDIYTRRGFLFWDSLHTMTKFFLFFLRNFGLLWANISKDDTLQTCYLFFWGLNFRKISIILQDKTWETCFLSVTTAFSSKNSPILWIKLDFLGKKTRLTAKYLVVIKSLFRK